MSILSFRLSYFLLYSIRFSVLLTFFLLVSRLTTLFYFIVHPPVFVLIIFNVIYICPISFRLIFNCNSLTLLSVLSRHTTNIHRICLPVSFKLLFTYLFIYGTFVFGFLSIYLLTPYPILKRLNTNSVCSHRYNDILFHLKFTS